MNTLYKEHLKDHPKNALRTWIMFQMLKGAGWAAAVFFGVIIWIAIARVIGRMLPVNPNPIDPMATGWLQQGAEILSRLV